MPPRPIAPSYTDVVDTALTDMSSCLGSNYTATTSLQSLTHEIDTNFVDSLLNDFMQSVAVDESPPTTTVRCVTCEEPRPLAVARCRDCSETLCAACVRAHRRVRITRDHAIARLDDPAKIPLAITPPNVAPVHGASPAISPPSLGVCDTHGEARILYCESCVRPACGSCAINEHRGHALSYVQDAVNNARTACATLTADACNGAQAIRESLELCQRLADASDAHIHRTVLDIRGTVRRYITTLEERQRELIANVERARKIRERTLRAQIDGLRIALARLARTSETLREALETATPSDLLRINERAASELRKLRAIQASLQPHEDDTVAFVAPEPALLRAIATLGSIRAASTSNVPIPPLLPPAGIDQNSGVVSRGRPVPGASSQVVVRAPGARQTPLIFGGEGEEDGRLCRPWGVCVDRVGNVIVADRSNNRIQVFRPDGTFLYKFGSHGHGPGQLDRPAGVCCDVHGRIIVVDKDNHRVQIFLADGTFVLTFGEKGSKNGQFNYPWDVAVNTQSQIVVADTRNHRIQLFGPDGTFLNKYGFEGASSMWKHFDSPRGVCFDPEGRILVTDFNNHRLVVIEASFSSARFLGSEGSGEKQFLRPQGVICDDEGNIIVADSRNNRIQVFEPNGGFLWKVGSGPGKGPVELDRPSGVCITLDGRIVTVDFGNHRIVMY